MRAVLDANVLVSALIRPQGPPGQILDRLLRDGAYELVASRSTLAELRHSLGYPRVRKHLALSDGDLDLWVEALAAIAVLVEGRVSRRVVEADPAVFFAVDQVGLEPSLEQMSDPPMPPVEPLRVGKLQSVHDPRQRNLAFLDREVDVVRHEAVRVDGEVKPRTIPIEPVQILLSVPVVSEDRLSLVAAGDHVMDRAASLEPRRPSDRGIPPGV